MNKIYFYSLEVLDQDGNLVGKTSSITEHSNPVTLMKEVITEQQERCKDMVPLRQTPQVNFIALNEL